MRLLPHGPVIRLGSREVGGFGSAKVIPALYSRPDWNCGRRLQDEEKRCGIHLTISSLLETPWKRRVAVAKSQTSDMQVNEVIMCSERSEEGIDVKREEGVFLQKRPKGRWKKISRQKTILVEDSPHSSFGDPEKSFYPRVQAYGKYVRRLGRVPSSKPVLKFAMYREGTPLSAVQHRLEYELGIEREAIYWNSSPTISALMGSVTQIGYGVGVSKELLSHASRHYNLNSLIFDPTGYISTEEFKSLEKQSEGGRGYFYRVLLRCVDVGETEKNELLSTFKTLRETGFINYFGLNHFGIGGNPLYEISRLRGRNRLDYAIGSYLQLLAEQDPYHHDFFMSYVNAYTNGTAAGIAKLWKDHCLAAKLPKGICQFINAVYEYTSSIERKRDPLGNESRHSDAGVLEHLWKALPHSSSLFDRSASEFVWNAMVSKRLEDHGLNVVPGDLVRLPHNKEEEISNTSNSLSCFSNTTWVHRLRSVEEARQFSMDDVVLPVPYTETVHSGMAFPETPSISRESFEAFAQKHYLDHIFSTTGFSNPLSSQPENIKCTYRKILEKPANVQLSVLRDPSSLAAIKTDLFLLQERKPIESFNLSYDLRVREPCKYNVSEKFVARMKPIRASCTGDKSVVLSFYLPDGCCPFVFLREAFDLRYGTFHDMLGLP